MTEASLFFVVDDDQVGLNMLIDLITDVDGTVIKAQSWEEASRLLKGAPKFDVALLDIWFPMPSPKGVQQNQLVGRLIDAVKQSAPTALVIVYSGNADTVSDERDALLARGADGVWERHQLVESATAFRKIVQDARAVRQVRLQERRPLSPDAEQEESALVKALQEQVGESVLREAAVAVRPTSSGDTYYPMAGGRSGDWVVHVRSMETGRPAGEWVLKLSRNANRLLDELAGAPLFGEPGNHHPGYGQEILRLSDGWFGLVGAYATGFEPLRSFLRVADASKAAGPIGRLAQEHLQPRFERAARADSLTPSGDRCITWSFAAEAEVALSDLAPWLSAAGVKPKHVVPWLADGARGQWRVVERNTYVCESHNDFHGGNVLVRELDAAVRVIDFAHGRIAPRLTDYATMLVDLFVHDELWSQWPALQPTDCSKIIELLARLDLLGSVPNPVWPHFSPSGRSAARQWWEIIKGPLSNCSPQEIGSTVALQLIRYGRFSYIPPGVRVILLGWADSLVRGLIPHEARA